MVNGTMTPNWNVQQVVSVCCTTPHATMRHTYTTYITNYGCGLIYHVPNCVQRASSATAQYYVAHIYNGVNGNVAIIETSSFTVSSTRHPVISSSTFLCISLWVWLCLWQGFCGLWLCTTRTWTKYGQRLECYNSTGNGRILQQFELLVHPNPILFLSLSRTVSVSVLWHLVFSFSPAAVTAIVCLTQIKNVELIWCDFSFAAKKWGTNWTHAIPNTTFVIFKRIKLVKCQQQILCALRTCTYLK